MSILLTALLACLIISLFYILLKWKFSYWQRRNVAGPKPSMFVGTYPNLIKKKRHIAEDLCATYNNYKHQEDYVGLYMLTCPQLLILNPKLIREILITSFHHFHNNEISTCIDRKKDSLLAYNPFVLTDDSWREQRGRIVSSMTMERLQTAYSIMQNVCHKLTEYIALQSNLAGSNGVDGYELAVRYASETIADCVLGLDAKSFFLQNGIVEPIPLVENSRKLFKFDCKAILYFYIVGLIPNITNIYRMKFLPSDYEKFFYGLMGQAFQWHIGSTIKRNDFKHFLMSMKEKENLNDTEMASHSMTFIFDGLDTTARAIGNCLLLLSREYDCQIKLRQEINDNLDANREIPYENLQQMPYLNACIYESMRMYPQALYATKQCTKLYQFVNKNGSSYTMKPGETVILPIYAIHHDPEFYPEPNKFKPERFLNNGLKRYYELGVYLAFGDGPRKCLGISFALAQMKAAISTIIRDFHIFNNHKTIDGNNLNPTECMAEHEQGVWLDFEKIR